MSLGPAVPWKRLTAIGLAAGIAVSIATPLLAQLERRFVALALVSLCVLAVAAVSRHGRSVFLFAWVLSLTYNRQFWSFAPIVGDHGAFGPYWMVSDLLLLLLLLLWVADAAILKRPQRVQAGRFLPWYGPFAVVAALSVLGAAEPAWAIGDLVRVAKLGLVLMYFRYNVGPREWWVVVAALGTALAAQSVLGILEVLSGRTGVLWIFGLQETEAREALGFEELFGGWTRATGTLAHPPYLAAFMLLTVPIFCSLALTLKDRRNHWLCAGVAVLGLVGLCCTLARLAIVLMMLQLILLVGALTRRGMLPLTRALAAGAGAGLVLGVLGTVSADLIHDRLTRDLGPSVDQRVEEYRVAIDMLSDHPLLGVGLNNYAAHMQRYGSRVAWGIERRWHEASLRVTHMRLLAGPLNGFLYVATVTGLLGLAAFLWLAAGGLILAGRAAAAHPHAPVRAVCLGSMVGMVGMYLHQALSYDIWVDTVISVWIVMIGLAGCAGARPGRDPTTC